jgi:short-subunit dehydrogenase
MAQRTIVITGASDGIGAAAARRLRQSGANVVVVGRSEGKTAAVAAALDADHFVADFADLNAVRALAESQPRGLRFCPCARTVGSRDGENC